MGVGMNKGKGVGVGAGGGGGKGGGVGKDVGKGCRTYREFGGRRTCSQYVTDPLSMSTWKPFQ